MAEKTSYKVGEAPWEKGAPKESFKVGEAPWEAGEPGVAAMGVPDGPTPAAEEESHPILNSARTIGKVLDAPRGALTAPLLGSALEAITGKKVYSGQDWANSINPTNLKTFPSSSEMYARAGVPEGAKLSDYAHIYAEPSENNPWYVPEKGGLLDPTLRGTGGFATDMGIDPLTWLSLGASGAAKKALAETATQKALQAAEKAPATIAGRLAQGAGKVAQSGADLLSMPGEAILNKLPQGSQELLNKVTRPFSEGLQGTGRKVYNSMVLPAEHEGAKFGKEAIGDTLYNVGAASPMGLKTKADDAVGILMNARDNILKQADQAGGRAQMSQALAPAREQIAKLRSIKDPDAWKLADELEASLGQYEKIEQGVPATPASPDIQTRGPVKKNAYGQDVMGDITVPGAPGTPGIPGSPYTPEQLSKVKSFIYSNTPTSAFQQNLNAPISARIKASLGRGLKEETENSVGRALGEGKAQDLAELNDEAGKILSARKGIGRVQNRAEQASAHASTVTGTDSFLAAYEPKAVILKKALDAIRAHVIMPAGYYTRKAGESQVAAPLADSFLRRKFINSFNQGDPNGQESN